MFLDFNPKTQFFQRIIIVAGSKYNEQAAVAQYHR
jgi:hypothetical protein